MSESHNEAMARAELVIGPGPMHPDLFGGYTPIMIELPVEEAYRKWTVRVYFSGSAEFEVNALTEAEAKRLARAEFDPWDSDYDIEIDSATPGEFIT